MVLFSRRLPSLARVPASPVPRSQRYYEGATTSHARISGHLFVSLPPPTATSCFVSAAALPQARRRSCRPGPWCRLPVVPVPLTWTRMGPLRSSGDPSRAFAPFQDPGRANVSSPVPDTLMLPPLPIQRRPRRYLISGLTCSFSTRSPYASGVALPPHPQGSLPAGGLRLCREGFEPSGSLRKVSVRWFDDHPPFLLS